MYNLLCWCIYLCELISWCTGSSSCEIVRFHPFKDNLGITIAEFFFFFFLYRDVSRFSVWLYAVIVGYLSAVLKVLSLNCGKYDLMRVWLIYFVIVLNSLLIRWCVRVLSCQNFFPDCVRQAWSMARNQWNSLYVIASNYFYLLTARPFVFNLSVLTLFASWINGGQCVYCHSLASRFLKIIWIINTEAIGNLETLGQFISLHWLISLTVPKVLMSSIGSIWFATLNQTVLRMQDSSTLRIALVIGRKANEIATSQKLY